MTVVANPRVNFETNAASYEAEMMRIKVASSTTSASFSHMGGVFGSTGEAMTDGLRKSSKQLNVLAGAMGESMGYAGKFSLALTSLATGGFNVLGLAVVGVGIVVSELIGHFKESEKAAAAAAKEAKEKYEKETEALQKIADLEKKRFTDARAARIAKDTGVSAGVASALEEIATLEARMAKFLDHQSVVGQIQYRQDEAALEAARKRLKLEETIAAIRGDKWMQTKGDSLSELGDARGGGKTTRTLSVEAELKAMNAAYEKEKQAAFDRTEAILDADDEADAREDQRAKDQATRDHAVVVAYNERTEALEQLYAEDAEALAKAEAAKVKIAEAARLAARSDAEKFRDGFNAEIAKLRADADTMGRLGEQVGDRLTEGLADDATDALMSIADGSESASTAFSKMAKSIVADLSTMIIKAAIYKLIMWGVNAVSGYFGGGTSGAGGASQSGGGSAVGAAPVAEGGGAKSMKVEIHNYSSGAQVSGAEEGTGADGAKMMRIIIEDTVADSIAKGGRVYRAMRSATGAQRVAARRG